MDTKPTRGLTLNAKSVSKETARIGGQAKGGREERYFCGFIDEVAVFKRALSEEEIRTLYQTGMQGKSLGN